MPQRSNDFQRLLLLIQHALAGNASVRESVLLTDRATGDEREVDILVESQAAIYPIVVSVECVAGRRKATIEWVERMWAKHQNLPTNQLVLVSRRGFTKSAEHKARLLGVRAMTLEDALNTDWASAISKIEHFRFTRVNTHITWVRATYERGNFMHNMDDGLQIFRASGDPLGTIAQLIDELRAQQSFVKSISEAIEHATQEEGIRSGGTLEMIHTLDMPEGSYTLDDSGAKRSVMRVRLGMNVEWGTGPVELQTGQLEDVQVAHGIFRDALKPAKIAFVQRPGEQFRMVVGWLDHKGEIYDVEIGSPEPADENGSSE